MTDKKPAPAADEAMPERPIRGAKLSPGARPGLHMPSIEYTGGEAPKPGTTLTFVLPNKVTYSGVVDDAVESDGKILVEFRAGIAPVPSK